MIEIETKPSSLNPLEIKKKNHQPTRSLNITRKVYDWQKINEANRVIICSSNLTIVPLTLH